MKPVNLNGAKRLTLVLLAAAAILPMLPAASAAPHVVIWDTVAPFAEKASMDNRASWKRVPTDLFTLEADPAKASSDPGYYGRGYSFQGDTVVETPNLAALFWSARGTVLIYSREDAASRVGPFHQIAELVPILASASSAHLSHCEIVRHAGDEVMVSCSAPKAAGVSALFAFDKMGLMEVKPAAKIKGFSVLSPIKYALVPDFISDDLIFNAAAYGSENTLCVPAQNVLLGLVKGGQSQMVMTWPEGQQQLKLRLNSDQGADRLIEAIDIDPDGRSFYLAALSATNVWHEEVLKPSYLEKDVAVQWERPFPAKWETQLDEADVRTTFAFRESKGQVWRGVAGSITYPVWFDGDSAFFRLSKKVPPKGTALIYFLEGQNTPLSISTPVDIMKATLGRSLCESILDAPGRKLRTHHGTAGSNVHRGCTCGFTEAIQAVFETGQETSKKDYVAAALDDMIFFVQCHLERIDEYKRFAEEIIKLTRARGAASTELKPFLENLEQIAQQIPQECNLQQENMKSLEHAIELSRQTLTLTGKKASSNLSEYMELLKAWRAMGGAQDYVVARCHSVTRKLNQTAGYSCATQPQALAVAKEVRSLCRQCLRNPDGYEIWADY